MVSVPHQLILFGPPGTSKSHRARMYKARELGADDHNIIPVTFHPEYSYGEFVARVLPLTNADHRIEYRVHAGPLIQALTRAYAELEKETPGKVLLLIDEINRGNCAEIFGDIFQLLDRDDEGWSSYSTTVSEVICSALKASMGAVTTTQSILQQKLREGLEHNRLMLPPNLHMIGTMNTSDESIFFMDSAFKRRWHFEFCRVHLGESAEERIQADALIPSAEPVRWEAFLKALNDYIRKTCTAPQLDDKLVGPWFIKARPPRKGKVHELQDADAWNRLRSLANSVTEPGAGGDNSASFENNVLAFTRNCSKATQDRILKLAGYDEGATRKFKAILSEGTGAYPYYLTKADAGSKGLTILKFLEALQELEAEVDEPCIQRADIAGKLCLYLWDNVYARDKTPLAELVGMNRQTLRTFDQFVDRLDTFIGNLMKLPSAVAKGEES